jgi:hypothetical protein
MNKVILQLIMSHIHLFFFPNVVFFVIEISEV